MALFLLAKSFYAEPKLKAEKTQKKSLTFTHQGEILMPNPHDPLIRTACDFRQLSSASVTTLL
jgi:hypothetical protein